MWTNMIQMEINDGWFQAQAEVLAPMELPLIRQEMLMLQAILTEQEISVMGFQLPAREVMIFLSLNMITGEIVCGQRILEDPEMIFQEEYNLIMSEIL